MRTMHLGTFLAATVLIGGCATSNSASSGRNAEVVGANDATRFSYGVGFSVGTDVRNGLHDDGLSADFDLVSKGFADAVYGRQPAMPKKDLDRVLRAVHRAMLDRASKRMYEQNTEFRQLADANAVASAAALDRFRAQPGVRTVEEGVYELVVTSGSGVKPGDGDLYVADWSMSLENGNVIDNRTGAKIDPDALLPVASRAIRTMGVGDHRKFAFAPEKAFGLGGDAPAIGPNEAIFIDITVTGSERKEASK
ncbi:MAG: FKBP-type peptidyl-prolyl cis-trans isomerase N-terminal domain-containing protein [Phycisphaerales bacterium]